ncbi:SdpI family protein [Enterococcus gallinarum]|uniref:SdpI family protein n=1 Tax=Enterococcus gallinarum TaxID=1353 RepID=UPI001D17082B|nr:SdpI family protein [Enterococcus gallinarum]MCC4044748.1 SdpI family protein [Enterococcus gallinarum]
MISFFTSCCFLLIAKTPPEKKINSFAGFRTKASMKNQEKWAYAQKEMIKYSEKRVFSTFLIGWLFFSGCLLRCTGHHPMLKRHKKVKFCSWKSLIDSLVSHPNKTFFK